jgi:hypothetical protein
MHCTHMYGWLMVSQMGVGALQSAGPLHGSVLHVPTEPLVAVQYSPVAQLFMPFTTRQPAVQVPVATVIVSQYEPGLQSVSLTQPHVAVVVLHTGVAIAAAHAELLSDEHWPHSPTSGAPVGWHAGRVAEGHEFGPGLLAE